MTDTATKKHPLPDWAEDMARIPFNPNEARRAANFAHSPCGMTPAIQRAAPDQSPKPPASNASSGSGLGFVDPNNPKHPVAHVDAVDRLVAQAEAQERAAAQAPGERTEKMMAAMTAAMAMMMQQQQQMLQMLAAVVTRDDDKPTKLKPKPKAKT